MLAWTSHFIVLIIINPFSWNVLHRSAALFHRHTSRICGSLHRRPICWSRPSHQQLWCSETTSWRSWPQKHSLMLHPFCVQTCANCFNVCLPWKQHETTWFHDPGLRHLFWFQSPLISGIGVFSWGWRPKHYAAMTRSSTSLGGTLQEHWTKSRIPPRQLTKQNNTELRNRKLLVVRSFVEQVLMFHVFCHMSKLMFFFSNIPNLTQAQKGATNGPTSWLFPFFPPTRPLVWSKLLKVQSVKANRTVNTSHWDKIEPIWCLLCEIRYFNLIR